MRTKKKLRTNQKKNYWEQIKSGNTGSTQGLRNRHRSTGDAGDTRLINQQRGRKQQRLKDEVQVERHWGQGSTDLSQVCVCVGGGGGVRTWVG